jgi:hypothetical protein
VSSTRHAQAAARHCLSPPQTLDEMEKVVQKVITPQFVRDCMKRMLAHTLPAVLKAGGHWPAKKFRDCNSKLRCLLLVPPAHATR